MEFESLRSLRLHGFPKFLHGLFMFITYPLRHPFKFLILLALLIFLAYIFVNEENPKLLEKVDLKEKSVFKETPVADAQTAPKKFAKNFTLKHAEPVIPETKALEAEKEAPSAEDEKKYQVWNIKTKEEAPSPKAQQPAEQIAEPSKTVDEPAKEISQEPSESEESSQKDILNETVEVVSGHAVVYGPNEIYIKNTYLSLDGIYTDPIKYNVEKASLYLRELISSEPIECYIVDKKPQEISSAICFKSGKNLSEAMVEGGFADRVKR